MKPEQVIELIEHALNAMALPYLLIRVPDGLALLSMDGRHVLIRVNNATLEVTR